MLDGGDAEELLTLAFQIPVIENRLLTTVAHAAHIDWVFPAFPIANRVDKLAIGLGHRAVVLLDAAAHLRKQLVAEARKVISGLFVEIVFRFEIRANVHIQRCRIPEHLLPVLIPQPGVIIGAGNAVLNNLDRTFLSHRRNGGEHGKGLGRGIFHRQAGRR